MGLPLLSHSFYGFLEGVPLGNIKALICQVIHSVDQWGYLLLSEYT